MSIFFIALAVLVAGGLLPLLVGKRFFLLRVLAALGIGGGGLLGCVEAIRLLVSGQTVSTSVSYQQVFELTFRIDALSAFFLMAIFGVSALAALYSFHYMDNAGRARRTAIHYLFFGVLVAAMALVVVADDMLAFLIAWELMALSSFFLVIYDHEESGNRRAGYQYLVFSHAGTVFILAAFAIIFARTGHLGFADAKNLGETTKLVVFILAFVGFGSKAGVFPVHFWLPHAHPAAPSHISALMSGVMIKTGIFAILKMISVMGLAAAAGEILLVVGVVSGVLGITYAQGQHDLKRLLAYSSVENVAIILIGLGIGLMGVSRGQPWMAVLGFAGGLLHVLNHALFKSLLFLGAGMVLHGTGSRAIDQLGGLLKGMRITGTTFLIGSLAIAALPPFNGFVSELLIYLGSFRGVPVDRPTLAWSLLGIIGLAVIGGLALACFTKVVGVVFQGEPRSAAAENAREHGWTMLTAMVTLALLCTAMGIFPGWFVPLAIDASRALGLPFVFPDLGEIVTLTGNITRFALLFLALVAGLALLRYALYGGKTVTRAGTWGCGYTQPTVRMQYTGLSFAEQILSFFRAVVPLRESHPPIAGRFPAPTHYRSHVEDVAETGSDRAVVRPVMALFDKLRWMQHGDIHLYIGYILLAIIGLMLFVWRA